MRRLRHRALRRQAGRGAGRAPAVLHRLHLRHQRLLGDADAGRVREEVDGAHHAGPARRRRHQPRRQRHLRRGLLSGGPGLPQGMDALRVERQRRQRPAAPAGAAGLLPGGPRGEADGGLLKQYRNISSVSSIVTIAITVAITIATTITITIAIATIIQDPHVFWIDIGWPEATRPTFEIESPGGRWSPGGTNSTAYKNACMYVHISLSFSLSLSIYIYILLCVYIYIYIVIYTYIYIYIYIYIHMHTHIWVDVHVDRAAARSRHNVAATREEAARAAPARERRDGSLSLSLSIYICIHVIYIYIYIHIYIYNIYIYIHILRAFIIANFYRGQFVLKQFMLTTVTIADYLTTCVWCCSISRAFISALT